MISRWTEEYKKVIYESRITLTRKLVSACKLLKKPPHLFLSTSYEGVYNMTAPHPTTNSGLTKALGRALSKPTIFPVPEFVLRLLYGEGAQVLTSGQTVLPKRLLDSGFQFDFPSIQEAVTDCLKS